MTEVIEALIERNKVATQTMRSLLENQQLLNDKLEALEKRMDRMETHTTDAAGNIIYRD